jgi:SsrA-binding protein
MAKNNQTAAAAPKHIASNRRALHDYALTDKLEAGLVLTGSEVKACREGRAQITSTYVQIRAGEAYLIGMHIGEYQHAHSFNHVPERDRKLLLHRRQIEKLDALLRQGGKTIVPLKLYFKHGHVKIEIASATGKRQYDRRQDVKEREASRSVARALRRGSGRFSRRGENA